jgi:hypothetical protein
MFRVSRYSFAIFVPPQSHQQNQPAIAPFRGTRKSVVSNPKRCPLVIGNLATASQFARGDLRTSTKSGLPI